MHSTYYVRLLCTHRILCTPMLVPTRFMCFLPLILLTTVEIDDLIAPATLFRSLLEILQRTLKNIIIIKAKIQPRILFRGRTGWG